MTTMEILNEIFGMVFDDDTIQISRTMTANDIDGWDSLSHVNLITAVEARFRIRFTQKELLTLKNIGDLYDTIDAKIVATSA
jgi:acyl carrier protein